MLTRKFFSCSGSQVIDLDTLGNEATLLGWAHEDIQSRGDGVTVISVVMCHDEFFRFNFSIHRRAIPNAPSGIGY